MYEYESTRYLKITSKYKQSWYLQNSTKFKLLLIKMQEYLALQQRHCHQLAFHHHVKKGQLNINKQFYNAKHKNWSSSLSSLSSSLPQVKESLCYRLTKTQLSCLIQKSKYKQNAYSKDPILLNHIIYYLEQQIVQCNNSNHIKNNGNNIQNNNNSNNNNNNNSNNNNSSNNSNSNNSNSNNELINIETLSIIKKLVRWFKFPIIICLQQYYQHINHSISTNKLHLESNHQIRRDLQQISKLVSDIIQDRYFSQLKFIHRWDNNRKNNNNSNSNSNSNSNNNIKIASSNKNMEEHQINFMDYCHKLSILVNAMESLLGLYLGNSQNNHDLYHSRQYVAQRKQQIRQQFSNAIHNHSFQYNSDNNSSNNNKVLYILQNNYLLKLNHKFNSIYSSLSQKISQIQLYKQLSISQISQHTQIILEQQSQLQLSLQPQSISIQTQISQIQQQQQVLEQQQSSFQQFLRTAKINDQIKQHNNNQNTSSNNNTNTNNTDGKNTDINNKKSDNNNNKDKDVNKNNNSDYDFYQQAISQCKPLSQQPKPQILRSVDNEQRRQLVTHNNNVNNSNNNKFQLFQPLCCRQYFTIGQPILSINPYTQNVIALSNPTSSSSLQHNSHTLPNTNNNNSPISISETQSHTLSLTLFSNQLTLYIKQQICSMLNVQGGLILLGVAVNPYNHAYLVQGVQLTQDQKQQTMKYMRHVLQDIQPDVVANRIYQISYIPVKYDNKNNNNSNNGKYSNNGNNGKYSTSHKHNSKEQDNEFIPGLNIIRIKVKHGTRTQIYSYKHACDQWKTVTGSNINSNNNNSNNNKNNDDIDDDEHDKCPAGTIHDYFSFRLNNGQIVHRQGRYLLQLTKQLLTKQLRIPTPTHEGNCKKSHKGRPLHQRKAPPISYSNKTIKQQIIKQDRNIAHQSAFKKKTLSSATTTNNSNNNNKNTINAGSNADKNTCKDFIMSKQTTTTKQNIDQNNHHQRDYHKINKQIRQTANPWHSQQHVYNREVDRHQHFYSAPSTCLQILHPKPNQHIIAYNSGTSSLKRATIITVHNYLIIGPCPQSLQSCLIKFWQNHLQVPCPVLYPLSSSVSHLHNQSGASLSYSRSFVRELFKYLPYQYQKYKIIPVSKIMTINPRILCGKNGNNNFQTIQALEDALIHSGAVWNYGNQNGIIIAQFKSVKQSILMYLWAEQNGIKCQYMTQQVCRNIN